MYLRALFALLLAVMPAAVCCAQTTGEPVSDAHKIGLALRTNLLYDAALIPNIGAEVAFAPQWTVGADWFYTSLSSDTRHRCWKGYGGYLTLRRYFPLFSNHKAKSSNAQSSNHKAKSSKLNAQSFLGHHLGLYVLGLTYDVEFGGTGYQADHFGFGGGIEYGYSLPVAHNLCIDFNLGVGYQGGEYKTYLPTDDGTGHYVWQATYMRHWWGPTKVEISLKWIIDAPVKKKTPAKEQIETPTEEESLPEAEGAEELAKKKGGEQ
jgi:hypothetical protein